jgi:exonuclease III
VAGLSIGVPSPAAAENFKIAYWNIKGGQGQVALPGHQAAFASTANCTDTTKPLNAWGYNVVQQELRDQINNDPAIIALGLGEAWTTVCGSPERVRAVLGWAARTTEQNGVAVVARYGFAGASQWQQLDTSQTINPGDTMWVVRTPVCLDSACTSAINIYTAHWGGTGPPGEFDIQARQTVTFMSALPDSEPHILAGDLNVWEGTADVCSQPPQNTALGYLRRAGYTDAWPLVNSAADGHTGMANRAGCGVPEGAMWKRIDYAWSKHLLAVSMTLFGVRAPGDASPSDHYGIIVEYQRPGSNPIPDTTAPTVSITSPVANATVAGTIDVAMSARDDRAVARVDLLVDGTVIGSATTAQYRQAWDTSTVVNGSHMLRARAYDTSGNAGDSVAVWVTVNNLGPPPTTSEDIVLYASHASTIVGRWRVVSDATAAGAARIWNPNLGAGKISAPVAAPADYFEITFSARAGTAYRLWMRGKAEGDTWNNDSVHVQFSGSATSTGGAIARIGTTSALTVNLEDCSGCGLAAWGWQDDGWGVGVLGPVVYFAQSGTQTIRVQPREDGLSIDQIVLSPKTYFTTPPGALKNDTTILPEAPGSTP